MEIGRSLYLPKSERVLGYVSAIVVQLDARGRCNWQSLNGERERIDKTLGHAKTTDPLPSEEEPRDANGESAH